ncbi:hypothetical protein N493_07355 [Clostridium botulinum B2 433]|uniref:hypothetical protein n=1 Tax=Clostridium botulinum TaxID=1491 RepID=UPI0007DEBFD7|nr:hypothetical protein [Clostridium botulinum]KEI89319.1 hypothetical protein N493_07355 [Clostridium botulinum B2 433]
MKMNVNFNYDREVSFTQEEINLIINILNGLQEKYKDVVINSVGDYNEFDDKHGACYIERDKAIEINQNMCSSKCGKRTLLKDFIKQRESKIKKIEKRKKINPDLLKYIIPLDGFGMVIESCIKHEFCHAIIHKYGLDRNKEIIDIFNSLSQLEISMELCSYATNNINEFICCCFEESFFEDSRPLSKKIVGIIDKVVFEDES